MTVSVRTLGNTVHDNIDQKDTTLCDKVFQWLVSGLWFSLGTPVSSTYRTDYHEIAEILLKVVLNIITLAFNDLTVNKALWKVRVMKIFDIDIPIYGLWAFPLCFFWN
jgi:hypothetical protein